MHTIWRLMKKGAAYDQELRTPTGSVVLCLAILGVLLVAVSHIPHDVARELWLLRLAMAAYLMSVLLSVLARWREVVAVWIGAAALIVLTHLCSVLLAWPQLLPTVVLPVGLSVTLVGLSGAAVLGAAETIFVLVLPGMGRGSAWAMSVVATLLVLWGVYVLLVLLHRAGERQWDQAQRVTVLLEEARERRLELNQAVEDWEHASRQLILANERIGALRLVAEEAQKTKAAFVAKVSHEFRTPLNMIIGLVGLMVEKPEVYAADLLPELMEDLKIVYRNSEHLAGMVKDVLDLSQAEAGRLVLHREQVNLCEIVEEAVAVVKPLIDKKRLRIDVALGSDLPEICCDRTRIRQVILNLLSNAARFTDKGSIKLSAERRDGHVVLGVADTGPGIASEDAERVFESFFQGSADPTLAKGGSGLGLSISKQFVELHGGRIWLESSVGVGTTFWFELPISAPLPRSGGSARWISDSWHWREESYRTERVSLARQAQRPYLVVYDETGELRTGLEAHGREVEVLNAPSIEEAGANVQENPAHLLLVNATDTERLLKLMGDVQRRLVDTPMVGSVIESRIERARRAGVDDYLLKPVSRLDLSAAIQRLGRPVRRVMVVDDDADFLRLIGRLLEACDESLEVTAVSSGVEALAQMRNAAPDLLLLDIAMPDLDGWQVLELKRQDPAIRDVPVIFVSAQDPAERPPSSPLIIASHADGLSVSKVLRCALEVGHLLMMPDAALYPAPG